ncbi:MAG: O-antigen ligase family protein [Terriglobales bacterium]
MPASIATLIFVAGIIGLFLLDRDPKVRTSKAMWIAVLWISLACSRSAGQWIGTLQGVSITDTASQETSYTEGSPMDRSIYTIMLLAGLIVLVGRRKKVIALVKANWPIVVFVGYCALSVIWSDFPDVTFKRWIKSLGDLVMVLIVLTERERYAAVKRVLAWTGFLLIPLSVLLIKFYPDLGRGYHPWTWTPYYTGVTTNKNELGRICLVLGLGFVWRILIALRLGRGRVRDKQLLAHGTCLAMVFWLFWMANSMTSLSCFVMASALMAVSSLRLVARRSWIVHAMVAAMLLVSVSTLFLDMGSGVLQSMGRDPTLTGRTDIWKLVLGMSGNPFLGTGFESFWLGKRLDRMWAIYWWHPREAHDGYIELYLALGWVGITLFGYLLATRYRTVVKVFRTNADEGRLRLAFFVVALAYNFAESAFGTLNPIWIFFLLATLTVPGGWTRKPHEGVPARERRPISGGSEGENALSTVGHVPVMGFSSLSSCTSVLSICTSVS